MNWILAAMKVRSKQMNITNIGVAVSCTFGIIGVLLMLALFQFPESGELWVITLVVLVITVSAYPILDWVHYNQDEIKANMERRDAHRKEFSRVFNDLVGEIIDGSSITLFEFMIAFNLTERDLLKRITNDTLKKRVMAELNKGQKS